MEFQIADAKKCEKAFFFFLPGGGDIVPLNRMKIIIYRISILQKSKVMELITTNIPGT